jgi:DNA-binding XRE family transcriptional regulator
MVNQPQLSKHSSTGVIDDALIIAVQKYRKQARMTQGLFAHFCGVTDKIISNFERHLPASDDTRGKIKAFLAGAPRQPTHTLRAVNTRPPNIYLTKKLLTWAQVTNMPSEGIEAVRALKEAYDRAKREEGLASIPLIQLEVENALTLATRGHYYKNRNK